jgi:hypothetical protein
MKRLGELPRRTNGPVGSRPVADLSTLIRMRNRSRAIGPRFVVPLPTGPSEIMGFISGVVAQATKWWYGPSDFAAGSPEILSST